MPPFLLMWTKRLNDQGRWHPYNAARNRIEFSKPSLVRFIQPHGGQKRVIVLGLDRNDLRQKNVKNSHANIDGSFDENVVADWNWWCLTSMYPYAIKTNQYETITEFLIIPEEHPDWWGYGQIQNVSPR